MKKGGYQIIDLKNTQLTLNMGKVFDGIYDLIEGTNKVKLVSGLNVGGTEYDDCYVDFAVSGTSFVGEVYGLVITVADTDTVTVTQKTV